MQTVNITEAKAHLSMLLKDVENSRGDVIINRGTHPIAKIVKFNQPQPLKKKRSLLGAFEGQMEVPDDFNEWPDDYAKAFGMKG